jgi:hypothetical protein
MDVIEAMDREVIVERAEAVRFWLLGFPLLSRATSAIQRELGAIIDNDPGTYINGQRPLAGLSIADFIAELHSPNGGAVGRVKSVGQAALNELRVRIPAATSERGPQAPPEPEYTPPEPEYTPPALTAAPPPAEGAGAQPRRRRGRPKGSTKAARRSAAIAPAASGDVPAAVIAPEPADAPPAEDYTAPAAQRGDDLMLSQIIRLWPSLHPHARRAVVMYASTLWVEEAYQTLRLEKLA